MQRYGITLVLYQKEIYLVLEYLGVTQIHILHRVKRLFLITSIRKLNVIEPHAYQKIDTKKEFMLIVLQLKLFI